MLKRSFGWDISEALYVLLDECYAYLNFAGEPVSGASVTECKEHIVVLGSLSKTYAMTGWRAGFALGPKQGDLGDEQAAVAVDFECREFRAEGEHRRGDGIAGVRERDEGGLHPTARPDSRRVQDDSGDYLHCAAGRVLCVSEYLRVSWEGGIKTATELAAKLLNEAHVVVVPGEAFGTAEHIRLSYAVQRGCD